MKTIKLYYEHISQTINDSKITISNRIIRLRPFLTYSLLYLISRFIVSQIR